jgi:hypothetical protein
MHSLGVGIVYQALLPIIFELPSNRTTFLIEETRFSSSIHIRQSARTPVTCYLCRKIHSKQRCSRVSHAIRLTLYTLSLNMPRNTTQSLMESGAASSDVQSAVSETKGVNPASLLLPPSNGYIQSDKAAFELLDPFNFTGNNIENMAWNLFDPQT